MTTNKFTVFSLRVAVELTKRGFPILGTGISIKNPEYKVFYFENTDAFREALADITMN